MSALEKEGRKEKAKGQNLKGEGVRVRLKVGVTFSGLSCAAHGWLSVVRGPPFLVHGPRRATDGEQAVRRQDLKSRTGLLPTALYLLVLERRPGSHGGHRWP